MRCHRRAPEKYCISQGGKSRNNRTAFTKSGLALGPCTQSRALHSARGHTASRCDAPCLGFHCSVVLLQAQFVAQAEVVLGRKGTFVVRLTPLPAAATRLLRSGQSALLARPCPVLPSAVITSLTRLRPAVRVPNHTENFVVVAEFAS